ncbi:hypothetical protein LF41_2653 [Lysobacter dokdonensis DS-58]|uniref:Transmembrane protein n=1 Tax=Lysobacter dokdonensis DS-58 TaxID=1300345 RepID=A0A0A2WN69_9GAMM|nr:hypothetical protein [Lysobacter dokdonensis]KGQ19715.1 hypothetical protein LF41_2653 [Lysobacter dokdonensis DS-58]
MQYGKRSLGIAIVLFAMAATPAFAQVQATVGGKTIELPAPQAGYTAVPARDDALNRLLDASVTPTNRLIAAWLSDGDLADAERGDIHEMPRHFDAQIMRAIESATVSGDDFATLRPMVEKQMVEQAATIQSQVNAQMHRVDGVASEINDAQTAITMESMTPMPVHASSERAFELSMRSVYARQVGGHADRFTVNASMALVHVHGKVLFLYAYGDENDLQWSRDALHAWVQAVVAANPGPVPTASTLHFDWKRTLGIGAAVALIAGLVALFAFMRKS